MDLRPVSKVLALGAAVLALLLWAATTYAAPSGAKPTPHPIEGRSECLTCHAAGTPMGVPADHEGRTNATCVACHPVESGPPAEAAPSGTPPAQMATPAGKNDGCLACHSNRDLSFTLADGTSVSAFVNPEDYKVSVHGSRNLACTDCHTNITGYPHPAAEGETRREFSFNMDEICQTCHSGNYSKSQDGVHAQMIASGNDAAPGCTDCHGVHNISQPDSTVQTRSQMCASCHQDTYGEYAASVHGKALFDESNSDVPDCVTCHGVHNMPDPRTAEFHVESPDLCAKCHADQSLMAKYGLSSRVVATYREEFHGVTTELYKTRYPTVWCYKAVCTDCHGVHGIAPSEDTTSAVHKENLPETCGKCHPGATANFAGAWIGHYEPSPTSSPLVYYVNLFYQILIPLLVLALAGFIALEIFRRAINRVRS